MKQTILRLTDAGGVIPLALIANGFGLIPDGGVLVAIGISIGLGLAIVWRALANA